jgi:hypothetical protein
LTSGWVLCYSFATAKESHWTYVYIVEGAGFGDDENQWELCYCFASEELAQNKVKEMVDEGCDPDGVRYTKMERIAA